MNREKVIRLKRIKRLEEKNLDQVVIKLKQVNQRLAESERRKELVASRHASEMGRTEANLSIQQLESFSLLADSVEAQTTQIQNQIEELTGQRTELLDEVAAGRSRIKGWQTLIEKLQREDADFLEKASMLEADDRTLRDFANHGSN